MISPLEEAICPKENLESGLPIPSFPLIFPFNEFLDGRVKVKLGDIVSGNTSTYKLTVVNNSHSVCNYSLILPEAFPPWIVIEPETGCLMEAVASSLTIRAFPSYANPLTTFYAKIESSVSSFDIEIECSCSEPPISLKTVDFELGTMVEDIEYVKIIEVSNASILPAKVDVSLSSPIPEGELSIDPWSRFIEPGGLVAFFFKIKPSPSFLDRYQEFRDSNGRLTVPLTFTSNLQVLPITCTVFGKITRALWEIHPFDCIDFGRCWLDEKAIQSVRISNRSDVEMTLSIPATDYEIEQRSVWIAPRTETLFGVQYVPRNSGFIEFNITLEVVFGNPPLKTEFRDINLKAEVQHCPIRVVRNIHLGEVVRNSTTLTKLVIENISESSIELSFSSSKFDGSVSYLAESLIFPERVCQQN